MIKSINKQININAISITTVDTPTGKVEVPIAYLSSTIDSDGKFGVNQSVQNEDYYFEHIEEAKNDYNEFYNKVIDIAKNR